MNKPILHIPSVISQSCFVDSKDEIVELIPKEVDYFFLLLFLYRKELLHQTPNLLLRNDNRYYFNEMVKYSSVDIEMIEFQNYDVVANYRYDGVKTFINKLSELSIKTNLYRKNKDRDIETIKVVETYDWNLNLLTINFTTDFVKLIIHTEKFFMNVDLSNVFKLSGGKAKLLYLMLKDYSKICGKDLRKNELQQLIGKIPQKCVFDGIKDQINEETDIEFSYTEEGIKKKKYKFKFNNKVNPKSTSKGKNKTKKTIDVDVMEKAKQKLQQMKDKGQKIGNEDGYLTAIYNKDMKKLSASIQSVVDKQKVVDKTDSNIELKEWINSAIDKLKSEGKVDYNHNNYLMFQAEIDFGGRKDMLDFIILDDYKIYDRLDTHRNYPYTTDSEDTMNFINTNKCVVDVFCLYDITLKKCTYSRIQR